MEGIIIREAGEVEATPADTDPSIIDAEVVEDSEPAKPEPRVANQPVTPVIPSVPFKPTSWGRRIRIGPAARQARLGPRSRHGAGPAE